MVEVELRTPVLGHSAFHIAVINGWYKSFELLVEGYVAELALRGYFPDEGATMPRQVCMFLTYTDFRTSRNALHNAALLCAKSSRC